MDDVENLNVQRTLGRLEGAVEQLSSSFQERRKEALEISEKAIERDEKSDIAMASHIAADAAAFHEVKTTLAGMSEVLNRIRKPVEAFITIKSLLVTITAVLAAAGAIVTGVPHYALMLPHYIYSFFNPTP